MQKGNSLLEAKKKNRIMIRNEILRNKYVTRAEIAENLGLTLPTVTTSVNAMIKEGIVMEVPIPEEFLKTQKGRTPCAVVFNPAAASFVGLEIAFDETRIVLVDLERKVIAEQKRPPVKGSYEEALEQICGMIWAFIASCKSSNVMGVGLGLTGVVDAENGVVRKSSFKNWEGRHIASDLYERLGISIRVDNNGHMRAIRYEMENGLSEAYPFAYFYAATGLVCPMAVHYDDLNGFLYTEGEIGEMILRGSGDEYKHLNDYARGYIIAEAKKMLPEKGAELDEEEFYQYVLDRQREGDSCMDEVFHKMLDLWAVGLNNMITVQNPGIVVAESRMLENEANWEYLKERFNEQHRKQVYQRNTTIVRENYDSFNAAKGAALCVLKRKYING